MGCGLTAHDLARGPSAWTACGSSVQGVSHIRDDLPCQDAHVIELIETEGTEVLVVVVSDGAGSAPKGGDGAALMCQGIAERCTSVVAMSPESVGEGLRTVIGDVREKLFANAEAEKLPNRHFACTVLCAVLHPAWSVFAQIGDGAIVVPEEGSGEWNWLFWPQRGEYANTTQFITDKNAMEQLQVDVIPHGVNEVSLFTDGIQHLVLHYESQQVHSPFFETMLEPLRGKVTQGISQRLSESLATYLSSPKLAAKAEDDLTLVLAARVQGNAQ